MKKLTFTYILFYCFISAAFAQQPITLNTTVGSSGYTGTYGCGVGAGGACFITFVIENTTFSPILLDKVGLRTSTVNNGNTVHLYYSATSLSGPISGNFLPTLPPTGWNLVTSGVINGITTSGVNDVLTNIGFTIPAFTTYRFSIIPSNTVYYSSPGLVTVTPNSFDSLGTGVFLRVGDFQIASQNVGYGGLQNPSFFTGSITYRKLLANNDAGVVAINAPLAYSIGNTSIVSTIRNFGKNQITSLNINWSINGVNQSPFVWSGLLDTLTGQGANSATINLGSRIFGPDTIYSIKVWTSLPNGVVDTSIANDTVTRVIRSPMSGTFSVGTGGDFATITAAADAVNLFGVNGPVVFNLINSNYNTTTGERFPINIRSIFGASAINTVTFKPALGISPLIVGTEPIMFNFDGASHVVFDGSNGIGATRNLTIKNYSSSSTVFMLQNDAIGNVLSNMNLLSATTSNTTGTVFLGASNGIIGNDSNIIRNNYFGRSASSAFAIGIMSSGKSSTVQNNNNSIIGNDFNSFSLNGIFITSVNNGNGSNWVVANNNFYDTATNTPQMAPWSAINFVPGVASRSANNQILNNIIGGNSPLALGGPLTNNESISRIAIRVSVANGILTRICSNQIRNWNLSNIAATDEFNGILLIDGIAVIDSNYIGDILSLNNARFVGINATSVFDYNIRKNTISNISVYNVAGASSINGIVTTAGQVINISNNIIKGCRTNSGNNGVSVAGIVSQAPSKDILISQNQIGTFSEPLSNNNSGSPSIKILGISNKSGIAIIEYNIIDGMFLDSTACVTAGTRTNAAINGILNTSSLAGQIIRSNTIRHLYQRSTRPGQATQINGICTDNGNITTINNNILYGFFSRSTNTSTGMDAALNGIHFGSGEKALIYDNYIDSLVLNSPTPTATQVNGIIVRGKDRNRVFRNIVKSIYNGFTTTTPGICGIQLTYSGINQECEGNVIFGLCNQHATTIGSIIGISYCASSSTIGNESFCNRNFVHSLSSLSTVMMTITGIELRQNMHGIVANNVIRIGVDTLGNAFTGPFEINGIYNLNASSQSANRIYHNTIYVGGTPASGSAQTTAYKSPWGGSTWSDIRNNIFVNVVQNNGGTGNNFAMHLGSAVTEPKFQCNYNILWAGNGLSNNFIGGGPGNATVLSGVNGWKRLLQKDINSIHGNPNLIAPAAPAVSVNMNMPPSNLGEGAGDTSLLDLVPIDFNGNQRGASTPADIGAFCSGVSTLGVDSVAPEIVLTPLTNTASIANRTIAVSIMDRNSGVHGGGFSPRLYFNKNSGVWYSVTGTLMTGNSRNGNWLFTINYSLLGGVVVNDTIRYYIAAQDSALNYGTHPAYGVGFGVANITHPPQSLLQYQIAPVLPTAISVGPTGNYPNLTGTNGLFNAINNGVLQGNTVVTLENGVTIMETGVVGLGQWLEMNNNTIGDWGYSLIIRPAGPLKTVIAGSVSSTNGMIKLNGADRVQLFGYSVNGLATDTNLLIRNTSTSAPALTLLNDANDIAVSGVVFETNNIKTVTNDGGALCISPSSIERGNDNIYIGNCYFRRAPGGGLPGILLAASGTTNANRENDNLLVENSVFYGFNSNAVSIESGTGDNIRLKNNIFFQDTLNNHTVSPTVINFAPGALSDNDTIIENVIGGNSYNLRNMWTVTNALSFTGISIRAGMNSGVVVIKNRISNICLRNPSASFLSGILAQSGVVSILNNYIGDTNNTKALLHLGNAVSTGINTYTASKTIISNNIVSGIYSDAPVVTSVAVQGIKVSSAMGILLLENNLVSNLRDSSIMGTGSTDVSFAGILITSNSTDIQVINNRIRNLSNVCVGAHTSCRAYGVSIAAGRATVINNIVEHLTFNVQNTEGVCFAGMILGSNIQGHKVNNNIIRYLNAITITPASTQLVGIFQGGGGSHDISGNTVHNLRSNTISSETGVKSGIIGILDNDLAPPANISQNTVFALEAVGATGANNVVGILYRGSTENGLNHVSGNWVHSFKASTNGVARMIGIQQVSGSFVRYCNNMIRLGIDSAGVFNISNYEVYGFLNEVAGNFEYYHNSVYLGGAPSDGAATTACIRLNNTPRASNFNDLRNNIFVNATSNNSTSMGKHYAIWLDSVPLNSGTFISNHNILYTPGIGGLIGGVKTTDYITLDSLNGWANGTLDDLQSGSADPLFINPTGSASLVNLHLQLGNPAEAGGDPELLGVVGIDIDGHERIGQAGLDVGADAGTFNLSQDIFAPSIDCITVLDKGDTSGPVLIPNVRVRDNVGVFLAGGLNMPRMYYKKGSGGSWVSNPSVSAVGSPLQAYYSFQINYGPLNGVTTGDTIYYYIVVQDSLGANLTSQNPLAIGTDVNNIISPPVRSSYYIIAPTIPINSKFYVGAGQAFSTLTGVGGLFEFLNNKTLRSSITAVITSNIVEPGTFALNQLGEEGPGAGTYTITIRPDSATTTSRMISGNSNLGLIRLNGADRVKITGVPDLSSNNNLNNLTIRNSSTSGPAVVFANGATQDKLSNLIVESANTTPPSAINSGVVSFGGTSTISGNSNDSIVNCTIQQDKSILNGIPTALISSFHDGTLLNESNVLNDNYLLNATISYINVDTGSGDYWSVNRNHFYTTLDIIATNPTLINFNAGSVSSGHTIMNNFIGGTSPSASGIPWRSTVSGAWSCIQLNVGNKLTTQVVANTIRNFHFIPSSSSSPWRGIRVNTGKTRVDGNMIGDSSLSNSIELNSNSTHTPIIIGSTVVASTFVGNNRIAGISINNLGGTTSLYAIAIFGGKTLVTNNIVGTVNTPNGITTNTNGTIRAIYVSVPFNLDDAVQIIRNTIANIKATSSYQDASLGGIQVTTTSVANISNNRIFNLSTNSTSTYVSTVWLTVFGISLSGQNYSGASVNNNVIYNIAAINTGASPTNATGIFIQYANSAKIKGNRIYNICNGSSSSAFPTASGILTADVINLLEVTNNQITLGDMQANNVQYNGIWQFASGSFDVNVNYNTVLITGNSNPGTLASYAYHKGNNSGNEIVSGTNLTNNVFINNRQGASLNFALAQETNYIPGGSGWGVINYNLLSSLTPTALVLWGANNLDFEGWKAKGNFDKNSWSESASVVNPAALFTDVANGNLNVVTTAPQNWYLNGKGIAGAVSGNINTDFNGNVRGTTLGFGTDLGANEFNSVSIPPIANMIGTPTPNGTTRLTFAGRTLATINWGASGIVPTALTARYYSGINPPLTNNGAQFLNAYLDVTASGGSGYTYSASLNYDPALLGNVTNENALRWTRFDTVWDCDVTSNANTIAQIITTPVNSGFGYITGTSVFAPLPVQWFSFKGETVNLDAKLHWLTALEHNNLGFEVERSIDGKAFEYAGFVKGNGNSQVKRAYQFLDAGVFSKVGSVYYRLKQVNANGTYTYSKTISLHHSQLPVFMVTPYPNPFEKVLTLKVNTPEEGMAKIKVFSLQGKQVFVREAILQSGNNLIDLAEWINLEGGIYFVEVKQGSFVQVQKVVRLQ